MRGSYANSFAIVLFYFIVNASLSNFLSECVFAAVGYVEVKRHSFFYFDLLRCC